jgi:DNA-binding response OmpR family regulator
MRMDDRAHRFRQHRFRRVLVATEDAHLRRYIAEALSRAEYPMDPCGIDTREILKRCGAESPSLLIVDVRRESLAGSEVVGELRAHGASIPVILLVGGPCEEARAPGSLVEYLTKPFTMEMLELAIDRAFTRVRLEEMSPGCRDQPPFRSE